MSPFYQFSSFFLILYGIIRLVQVGFFVRIEGSHVEPSLINVPSYCSFSFILFNLNFHFLPGGRPHHPSVSENKVTI